MISVNGDEPSADHYPLITEVRDQFQPAAQSCDVAGQTLDRRAVGLAVLDLAHASLAHPESGSNLLLRQMTGLPDLGELVSTDLSPEVFFER